MATKPTIVAGIDVGAATVKAVILKENAVLSAHVLPTGDSVAKTAWAVIAAALGAARLSMDQIRCTVSTGYGRRAIDFADEVITEISCHAKGVGSLISGARTVIDIGGQDSKVIAIDGNGNVANFVMNDKCAAGTGRFLEVMAKVLNADIADIGVISLESGAPCRISNTCTVFAESEMVTLRAEGRSREDIFAGIHAAMAHRIAIMGSSVGFREQIVFTGGVAKNAGMKKALEDRIGKDIHIPEEPQIIGALGASIIARDKF